MLSFAFIDVFLERFISKHFSMSRRNSSVKTAIVMLNMGGPQHIDQVSDYLHRIMTDTDMIQLPVQKWAQFLDTYCLVIGDCHHVGVLIFRFLGPYIARKRTPDVQKKYTEIGGGSPILKWTNLQVGTVNKLKLIDYDNFTLVLRSGWNDVQKIRWTVAGKRST